MLNPNYGIIAITLLLNVKLIKTIERIIVRYVAEQADKWQFNQQRSATTNTIINWW